MSGYYDAFNKPKKEPLKESDNLVTFLGVIAVVIIISLGFCLILNWLFP